MSWFHEPSLMELEDQSPNEEVADGVVVTRRRMLTTSIAAAGGLAFADTALARAPRDNELGDISLAELLEEALPLSRNLIGNSAANEDAYLFRVASLIARLSDKASSPRGKIRSFRKENAKPGEGRFPLGVVQMKMKPGGRIPHHDHRDYNGIIVGVEGSLRIKNFDIVGGELVPPEGKTFQIRETLDASIIPGRYSMVGRQKNNIHDLVAGPEGAVVLDVFTFYKKNSRSFMMDVEPKARDADQGIFDAAWRPRRR